MKETAPVPSISLVLDASATHAGLIAAYYQIVSICHYLKNPVESISIRLRPIPSGQVDSSPLLEALNDPRVSVTEMPTEETDAEAGTIQPAAKGLTLHASADFLAIAPIQFVGPCHCTDVDADTVFEIMGADGNRGKKIRFERKFGGKIVSQSQWASSNNHFDLEKLEQHVGRSLCDLRVLLRRTYSNRLFWNSRYETNPNLGSGVGSRGIYSDIKKLLLNSYIVPFCDSVLDCGCGDLQVVNDLDFRNYVGVDESEKVISVARNLRPDWEFHNGTIQSMGIGSADAVMCFEVLIHINTLEQMQKILQAMGNRTRKRLIVSGYDRPIKLGLSTFFHKPLCEALIGLAGFGPPVKVACYEDLSIYVVDRAGTDLPPAEPLEMDQLFSFLFHQSNDNFRRISAKQAALTQRLETLSDTLRELTDAVSYLTAGVAGRGDES